MPHFLMLLYNEKESITKNIDQRCSKMSVMIIFKNKSMFGDAYY